MGLMLRTVWFDLYRRRLNFLLVVIVAAIAVYMLDMVLMIRAQANYQIYMVKSLIHHEEQLLNINIIFDSSGDYEIYNQRVIEFARQLKEQYPNQYGYNSETPASIKEDNGQKQDVLYLDQTTSEICLLRDTAGERITLTEDMCDGQVWPVYIGYNLQNKWSVGDVITDSYQNRQFEVKGVLEQGSSWIGFPILGTVSGTVSLDQYIVCPHPAAADTDSLDLFFMNSYNGHFIRTDKENMEAVKQDVRRIADECGVILYCQSIDEIITRYRQDNREVFDAIGILCIFTLLIAVCAIGAASLADVCSRQYDFGIMYIQGVSSIQIYGMILLEVLIKLVLSGSLAVAYYARTLINEERYVHTHMVMPQIVCIIFVLAGAVSYISYRGVLKHKMTDYIGGAFR